MNLKRNQERPSGGYYPNLEREIEVRNKRPN